MLCPSPSLHAFNVPGQSTLRRQLGKGNKRSRELDGAAKSATNKHPYLKRPYHRHLAAQLGRKCSPADEGHKTHQAAPLSPVSSSESTSLRPEAAADWDTDPLVPYRFPFPCHRDGERVPTAQVVALVGSWCGGDASDIRPAKLDIPGGDDGPGAPRGDWLPSPDLPPLCTDFEFCACCEDEEDGIGEVWYLRSRAKMDDQSKLDTSLGSLGRVNPSLVKNAMEHIEKMNKRA